MLSRLSKLRSLHIFIIGLIVYLVIFNIPEVLLHVTSIGIGGHKKEVADVLTRILLSRIFISGPLAFLFTFAIALLAAGYIWLFIYLPVIKFLSNNGRKRFSFEDATQTKFLIGVACLITCLWKITVEISDPQTSQKQFEKDIGIVLPSDAELYRAFHKNGGYLASAAGIGKNNSYQFRISEEIFSRIAEKLLLKPLTEAESSAYTQLEPTSFQSPLSLEDYEAFIATNKQPPYTSFRLFLYHRETGQVLATAYHPPR